MKMRVSAWFRGALLTAVGLGMAACEPSGAKTDSQTNWLRACDSDAQCGELHCLCGVCTRPCDAESACQELDGAACVSDQEAGSIALCGGQVPSEAGFCLPRCDDGECESGQMCVAGACSPLPVSAVSVVVDSSVQYQALIGFGATLAYAESEVVRHPRAAELYAAMSAELGLDVLRLRNRFGYTGDDHLSSAGEITRGVAERLGRDPTLLLTSWSPPAAMKASGTLECQGNPELCTLAAAAPDGGFDYASFAAHWRASLEAYAVVGVVPDLIGIQNNPDFVPVAAAPGEACRFLPTEAIATVSVDGTDVEVPYPGFAEALSAVADELVGLASPPGILAPETSDARSVADYASALDLLKVDALAHHLYGTDPAAVDISSLAALGELAQSYDRPLLQTEMLSDGFGTARLMHYSLAVAGAAAYLHGVLAGPASFSTGDAEMLISVNADDFALEGAYHAIRHYALHTDPEWTRVEAASDAEELLATAWLSPAGDSLTVVLVNAGTTDLEARIELAQQTPMTSEVIRTVFSGVERSAELGALSAEGILRVPGQAIVTVALRR